MSTTPPQFGTAEYKTAGGESCRACNQPISGEYYRINGIQSCTNCAEKLKAQVPKDSHAAFVRGMLFGVGGAIVGLIVYSAFGILTGIMIGYVSLAVGWLVGKAIRMGSRGVGGRRYQIAALGLTYAAVSIGAVPIWISQIAKRDTNKVVHAKVATGNGEDSGASQPSSDAQASGSAPAPDSAPVTKPSLGHWLGMVILIGLASPFLKLAANAFGGLIGLVILAVGMNIAWKETSAPKLEILGPFKADAPAPAGQIA